MEKARGEVRNREKVAIVSLFFVVVSYLDK